MLVGLVYACRKDFQSLDKQDTGLNDLGRKMDVKLAQKLYANLMKEEGDEVKILATDKSRVNTTKGHNRKYPIFKKAYLSQTDQSTFIEVPVVSNQRYTMIMKDPSAGKLSTSDQEEIFRGSLERLLIYKNKKTGVVHHRLITYIPEINYLEKHHSNIKSNQINRLDDDLQDLLNIKNGTERAFISCST